MIYIEYSIQMWNFWSYSPIETRVGFEDVKRVIQTRGSHLLINTLSIMEQHCLICSTLAHDREESIINHMMESASMADIVVYGKHSADETPYAKQKQLKRLGFERVYVYGGGLFEWLLLQDIYGASEFPTTSVCKDLLAYRPTPKLEPRAAITF